MPCTASVLEAVPLMNGSTNVLSGSTNGADANASPSVGVSVLWPDQACPAGRRLAAMENVGPAVSTRDQVTSVSPSPVMATFGLLPGWPLSVVGPLQLGPPAGRVTTRMRELSATPSQCRYARTSEPSAVPAASCGG